MKRTHALLVLCLAACGGDAADEAPPRTEPRAGAAPPSVAAAVPGDTSCPATGLWAECSLLERLDRAGLVPVVDSADGALSATEEPLSRRGLLIRLGRGTLEVYLYPDAESRERDQRRLPEDAYVSYTGSQTFRAEPSLIGNANALAILHSVNSKQRERVGDAITAGPPLSPP